MTADDIMDAGGEWTAQRIANVRAALNAESWPLFFDLTSAATLGDGSPQAVAAMARANAFMSKAERIGRELDEIERRMGL